MIHKAIISGGTGLVGQSVARYLANNGVDVLCIGRSSLLNSSVYEMFGKGVTYLTLDINDISDLYNNINNIIWEPGSNCVFYPSA